MEDARKRRTLQVRRLTRELHMAEARLAHVEYMIQQRDRQAQEGKHRRPQPQLVTDTAPPGRS